MSWYIRKPLAFGRFLRLNLSRSGVGLSVGVKGARIGIDGGGTPYAAAGRYGLYWKERFGSHRPGSVSSGALDFLLIALALAALAAVFASFALHF